MPSILVNYFKIDCSEEHWDPGPQTLTLFGGWIRYTSTSRKTSFQYGEVVPFPIIWNAYDLKRRPISAVGANGVQLGLCPTVAGAAPLLASALYECDQLCDVDPFPSGHGELELSSRRDDGRVGRDDLIWLDVYICFRSGAAWFESNGRYSEPGGVWSSSSSGICVSAYVVQIHLPCV
jgi:hypothetical protein